MSSTLIMEPGLECGGVAHAIVYPAAHAYSLPRLQTERAQLRGELLQRARA